jgi:hypothetical protein
MEEKTDLIPLEAKLELVAKETRELMAAQTQALTVMANSMQMIANFLESGVPKIIAAQAKAQGVNSILGGLMTKEGRGGLDARFIKQNAVETVEVMEAVHAEYQERLAKQAEGNQDPKIHDPEASFREWAERVKTSQNS